MSKVAGVIQSYQEPIGTGGNREDLSDILYDVSPTDTPFLTLAKKGKPATAVYHEWLTDALEAPKKNAVVEGNEAVVAKANPRVRIGNYTQILEKTAGVAGTQETVHKGGGIKSEMSYQIARRLKEIKRDMEAACVGGDVQIAKAGSEDTPREMASFVTFMNKDSWIGGMPGKAATAPTGDGKTKPVNAIDADAVVFGADILNDCLQKLWTNSGGSDQISAIMGAAVRGKFSKLEATSTRWVSTDKARLQASIDVYDGDFHVVTAMPDRYCDQKSMFLIDPEYVEINDLRPIFSQDLAKVGDAVRKQVIWETTLKVGNPLAHFVISNIK